MPIDPIPDDAAASPSDAYWLTENSRWYKPGFAETAKLLGWRWLYWLPLLALIALMIFFRGLAFQFLISGWKLILFASVIPIAAFASAAKHAIRNRKDPFCIHCGYSLIGLPDGHRCPECGERFLFRVIDEYRRDPTFFVERIKAAKSHPIETMPFNAGTVRRKGKSRDGT